MKHPLIPPIAEAERSIFIRIFRSISYILMDFRDKMDCSIISKLRLHFLGSLSLFAAHMTYFDETEEEEEAPQNT